MLALGIGRVVNCHMSSKLTSHNTGQIGQDLSREAATRRLRYPNFLEGPALERNRKDSNQSDSSIQCHDSVECIACSRMGSFDKAEDEKADRYLRETYTDSSANDCNGDGFKKLAESWKDIL